MADRPTPKTSSTVQGSQTPVETSLIPSWPDGAVTDVDARFKADSDFAAAGGTENIVGKGVPHKAAFVLGKVPD